VRTRIARELTQGTEHRFADWPIDVPGSPGVYAIWLGRKLLYVGAAGGPAAPQEGKRLGTFRARLATHASGRRLGDPFSLAVADQFVVPQLMTRLQELARGQLSVDHATHDFIREHCSFRLCRLASTSDAIAIQREIVESGIPVGAGWRLPVCQQPPGPRIPIRVAPTELPGQRQPQPHRESPPPKEKKDDTSPRRPA